MTPMDKQQAFLTQLKALLHKFDAELNIELVTGGHFDDHKMVIDFENDETFFDECGTSIVPQLDLGKLVKGVPKEMEMDELPEWLQELWDINPSLARKAEKDLNIKTK